MHAMPEALRQIIHQHEIDEQQRVRVLFKVEMKLCPLSPIDPWRLDRQVDVRPLEVVAARPRPEQPHPLDRGMAPQAAGQILDQGATRKVVGQCCGHRVHRTASRHLIPAIVQLPRR
jgi:hypothetical protein